MSEKILGIEVKSAMITDGFGGKVIRCRKLVPVVSLQALKEYCEQNELRIERQELEENSYPIVFENRRLALLGDGDFVINKKDLLSWAEKEAKGQVLKK